MNRRSTILLLICLIIPSLHAAERNDSTVEAPLRPLTAFYALSIGSSMSFDTYLSPVRYHGTHMGLLASWSRAMAFNPEKFVMDFDVAVGFDLNSNESKTSSMTGFDITLAWDMLYRIRPAAGLQMAGGAGLEFNAGALYLPRNSNNPVAAKISLDLTLNLRADYSFRLGRLPVTLTDRVSLPSLGIFFSPQYGESYYEIYLGNHSGLTHCGWWGNHFAITNLLMVQLNIFNIRLCAGYRASCRSSYVNHINTRLVDNSFVIGIATDWLNVTKDNRGINSKTISAVY